MGPWGNPSVGLGGEASKTFEAVYVWRVNNSLNIGNIASFIYFECKLEAKLFLYALK